MSVLPPFEHIFGSDPGTSYTSKAVDQISKHRRELGGTLFFDRLLTSLTSAPQASSLYPPRSQADLRKLYTEIASGAARIQLQLSALYYVLCDLSLPGRNATSFARTTSLPTSFTALVDGLWAFDRLDFAHATSCLSTPGVPSTFAADTVIVLHKYAEEHNDRSTLDLALGYYESISSSLGSSSRAQQAHDIAYRSACILSVTEAFLTARRQRGEIDHRRHLEMLFDAVLNTDKKDQQRAEAAVEMVGLPFTRQEEVWFIQYLSHGGAGGMLQGAKDAVMMRRLLTGDFEGARNLSGEHAGKHVEGLNWQKIMFAMEK